MERLEAFARANRKATLNIMEKNSKAAGGERAPFSNSLLSQTRYMRAVTEMTFIFAVYGLFWGTPDLNRFWDFQSPYKSVGTTLTTFLACFWTLGRLRRHRLPSHHLSCSSRSSIGMTSSRPPRIIMPVRVKSNGFPIDFQGFSRIY